MVHSLTACIRKWKNTPGPVFLSGNHNCFKMCDHLEIISQLILFNAIVLCQFNNKMIIFWSKASHCFAPLSIIRTVIQWMINKYFEIFCTTAYISFSFIYKRYTSCKKIKKLQTLISPSQIHVHLHAAHLIIFIILFTYKWLKFNLEKNVYFQKLFIPPPSKFFSNIRCPHPYGNSS